MLMAKFTWISESSNFNCFKEVTLKTFEETRTRLKRVSKRCKYDIIKSAFRFSNLSSYLTRDPWVGALGTIIAIIFMHPTASFFFQQSRLNPLSNTWPVCYFYRTALPISLLLANYVTNVFNNPDDAWAHTPCLNDFFCLNTLELFYLNSLPIGKIMLNKKGGLVFVASCTSDGSHISQL